jgi:hypothetical protein
MCTGNQQMLRKSGRIDHLRDPDINVIIIIIIIIIIIYLFKLQMGFYPVAVVLQ